VDQDSHSTDPAEADAGKSFELCRFLKHPFPDCYCVNLTGRKITKVVAFCAGDYQACSIFRSKVEPQDKQSQIQT
jgi:hypothetical protein